MCYWDDVSHQTESDTTALYSTPATLPAAGTSPSAAADKYCRAYSQQLTATPAASSTAPSAGADEAARMMKSALSSTTITRSFSSHLRGSINTVVSDSLTTCNVSFVNRQSFLYEVCV